MRDLKNLNYRLIEPTQNGDIDAVKALTPQNDPKFLTFLALQKAAQYGDAEGVKLLIPVSQPQYENSHVLQVAAFHGHTECVTLLIPVTDPKANNSRALFWAAEKGHAGCVSLLLPVSDSLALDPHGLTPSDRARTAGHSHVAGMIDAFIEAQSLSHSLLHHRAKPASKASL